LSNFEQIDYTPAMPNPETNKRKAWRVEVNNPDESTKWKFLWEFDEKNLIQAQELIDELNIINAPVQLRIVPNTD
jgi:hypothetical protein